MSGVVLTRTEVCLVLIGVDEAQRVSCGLRDACLREVMAARSGEAQREAGYRAAVEQQLLDGWQGLWDGLPGRLPAGGGEVVLTAREAELVRDALLVARYADGILANFYRSALTELLARLAPRPLRDGGGVL